MPTLKEIAREHGIPLGDLQAAVRRGQLVPEDPDSENITEESYMDYINPPTPPNYIRVSEAAEHLGMPPEEIIGSFNTIRVGLTYFVHQGEIEVIYPTDTLSVSQAAEILGVSDARVYQLIRDGDIEYSTDGWHKRPLKSSVERLRRERIQEDLKSAMAQIDKIIERVPEVEELLRERYVNKG